jgi:hypothetical protein
MVRGRLRGSASPRVPHVRQSVDGVGSIGDRSCGRASVGCGRGGASSSERGGNVCNLRDPAALLPRGGGVQRRRGRPRLTSDSASTAVGDSTPAGSSSGMFSLAVKFFKLICSLFITFWLISV